MTRTEVATLTICDRRFCEPSSSPCGKPAKYAYRWNREDETAWHPRCARHARLTPWNGERKPLSA